MLYYIFNKKIFHKISKNRKKYKLIIKANKNKTSAMN